MPWVNFGQGADLSVSEGVSFLDDFLMPPMTHVPMTRASFSLNIRVKFVPSQWMCHDVEFIWPWAMLGLYFTAAQLLHALKYCMGCKT